MADDKKDKTVVHNLEQVRQQLSPDARKDSAYFIVIQGSNVGRMYKLTEGDFVIGRGLSAHIRIDDDGVSRIHSQIIRRGDGAVVLEDAGSTNGTFLNGEKISSQVLADGDKVQIGRTTILKFSYQDNIEEAYTRQMYDSATKDGLTGILNKRSFVDRATGEFTFAVRHDEPLTLVFFDIDHFKKINDTHGHPAGDSVLRGLAVAIQKSLRAEDVFARYGGEEFVVLARGIDHEGAFVLAERMRRLIEATVFEYDGVTIPVTVSVGAATLVRGSFPSIDNMIRAADEFLYRAKSKGRNRVECSLVQE
ncbi:MAG: GGDEF domain-containing protein [Deltaproteobacteria bacterium]|nr:GGDEF domain-containing protein [Deltaproteobacteria bacterium]